MKKLNLIALLILVVLASCNSDHRDNALNLRLKWAYQAQFAGYLVAQEKGFYKDAGVDISIRPAGPDIKPYSTVASGADDVGVGIISQILTARSNGVPLVGVAQIFQDSPNRFVLKSENKIETLRDLKGKKVGLWMGGDEVEFISMLKSVGMSLNDIEVIPQKFSIAPFLEDTYICSQVMVYNELNQIENRGFTDGKLQILSPKDYNSAILGDMLFTNERFLRTKPDLLKKFIEASKKGWDYTKEHPQEAIDIVLKYNKELNKAEQLKQLNSIISIIYDNNTDGGFGHINPKQYSNSKTILLGGLKTGSTEYQHLSKVNVDSAYTTKLVQ